MSQAILRFAPSPSGQLHLGHVYSALFSYHKALQLKGKFLIRIEDIDIERCKPEYEKEILEDLEWLGLEWDANVRRQSAHMNLYKEVSEKLRSLELLFPCFCSRRVIRETIAARKEAGLPIPQGPDGPLYPKTCLKLPSEEIADKIRMEQAYSLRLNSEKALEYVKGKNLSFIEHTLAPTGMIAFDPTQISDMILARKEIPTSYHISVVVDDALQGITHVTRGADLYEATHMHRLLQEILDYPAPEYAHHPLILGADGIKLAKRRGSQAMRDLHKAGLTPEQIRDYAGATQLWNEIREMRGY